MRHGIRGLASGIIGRSMALADGSGTLVLRHGGTRGYDRRATHDDTSAIWIAADRRVARRRRASASAQAQNYPNRPITVIVPFPAGGLTDVPARVAATMMSEKIGQNMVVENKTGATGTIGAGFAARATPDGYTLFANSLADAQNIHFQTLTYSPVDDFAQIGWIVDGPPLVLMINAKLPYKTLADLIAAAKADPKSISFGTSGPASSPGDGGRACSTPRPRPDMVAVPYRGSGDAAREDGGRRDPGRVHVRLAGQAAGRRRQGARARGRSAERASRPGPMCRPSRSWATRSTSAVSSGSPRRPRRRSRSSNYLNKKLNEVVQSDAFKARMAALGMTVPPASDNTPAKYDAFIREEIVRQGELAKLAKAASPEPAK